MITIQKYHPSYFETLDSWWEHYNETAPTKELIPESTFIVFCKDTPILSVSLILGNITEYCTVDNFIGNPDYEGPIRHEAGFLLNAHIAEYAKNLGYKKLFCMSYREPVKRRYEELGYVKTLDNVTTYIKEI